MEHTSRVDDMHIEGLDLHKRCVYVRYSGDFGVKKGQANGLLLAAF
jgi:hypothetical protein